jgi:histone arginine demethylase JMJD6
MKLDQMPLFLKMFDARLPITMLVLTLTMKNLSEFPYRAPVDILVDPDREIFERDYIVPAKPVLIRGAIRHWPAMSKWTHEYFADNFGSVEVYVHPKGRAGAGRRIALSDYIAYIERTTDPDPLYLANWTFGDVCPSLLHDYFNPPIFERLEHRLPEHVRPQWRWIFLGPAGSGTPLHVDVMYSSAWNAAITGRKRWLFYAPNQVRQLYQGAVDCFAPDLSSFPLFEQARGLECVQEPGDLVFTPSGWWHQVYNEVSGISVTENFINQANLGNVKLAAPYANLPHLDSAIQALT